MSKKVLLKSFQRLSGSQNEIRSENNENEIEIIWSTGYKDIRHDPKLGSFYEELDMSEDAIDLTELNSGQAPFVLQHEAGDVRSVIGVIKKAWIDNGVGKAIVRLSKRKDVEGYISDILNGILRNVSVGYRVEEYTDVSNRGDEIPTLVATKWKPREVSIVSIGFDPFAKTIRASDEAIEVVINQKTDGEKMTEAEKLKALQEKLDAGTELTEAEKAEYEALKAKLEALSAEEQRKADLDKREKDLKAREEALDAKEKEASDEAVKAKQKEEAEEEDRKESIRSAVKAADLNDKVAEDMITRKVSIKDIQAEVIRAIKAKTNNNEEGNQTMTKREMAEQALLNRIDSKRFKVDSNNPYKGASLIQCAESVVERKSGESDASFVKRAIVTSDLQQLLANVANKSLVQEGSKKFTYEKWTTPITVRDFKENSIVTLGAYTLAEKVEGENYALATLADSDEKITLRERGIRFAISQKAMINDDLGALKQLPSKGGLAGYRDVEATVYASLQEASGLGPVMSDTKRLFHADHNNTIDTGAAPTVAGVHQANMKFAQMTGNDGQKLDLRTKIILCPPALELIAKQTAGVIAPNEAGKVNPFAGEIEVVVSSRLTNPSVWYAICDREELPSYVVATLEGQAEPVVSTDEDFKSSNFELKVEYPNAAAPANHKSIIKVTVDGGEG